MKPLRVVAAILTQNDQYLIARRKSGALAGYWEFPGGKIQEGETPQQALKRELKEELSIETEIGEYVGTSKHQYPDFHIELIVYFGTILSGEIQLSDHDAVLWLSREALGNIKLAPADVPLLKLF